MDGMDSREEPKIEQAVLEELRQQPLYMLEAASSLRHPQKDIAAAFERLNASGAITVPRLHGRFRLAFQH
jgi:hypothetical protein